MQFLLPEREDKALACTVYKHWHMAHSAVFSTSGSRAAALLISQRSPKWQKTHTGLLLHTATKLESTHNSSSVWDCVCQSKLTPDNTRRLMDYMTSPCVSLQIILYRLYRSSASVAGQTHRKRSREGYQTQMFTVPTEDVEAVHLWQREVRDRKVGCLSL